MNIKLKKEILQEKYLQELLKSQYLEEQNIVNETMNKINLFLLNKYKELYPTHFMSYRKLQNFVKNLSELKLLPTEEEFIELNKHNEFFDMELTFFINDAIQIKFQYPLNISKLTSYIKKNNIPKVRLGISDLKKIIRQVCFDEFDYDMQAKKEGRDCLESIKKENPIMLLNGGHIFDTYLINGNHRVIQAIRDNKKTVDVYVIPESLIECCGMTEDYEKLYSIMKNIPANIYGGKYLNEINTIDQ